MQTHQIPKRPWSVLATEIFNLHSTDYYVLVDCYSDFVGVSKLTDTTSVSVIQEFRQQFSRHGIPDVLLSHNVPQFTSYEFREFASQWEFKHVSSSPHHHKANGNAEATIETVKSLFKKATPNNQDPWMALLDYRNTPTEGKGTSSIQRLCSK